MAPKQLTPEQAAEAIRSGEVVRLVVGHGDGDPVLMIRTGKAYGADYILTTAVGGWSEGVTEPVCELGSSFLTDKFLTGRVSLTIEPDGRAVHGLTDYED